MEVEDIPDWNVSSLFGRGTRGKHTEDTLTELVDYGDNVVLLQ